MDSDEEGNDITIDLFNSPKSTNQTNITKQKQSSPSKQIKMELPPKNSTKRQQNVCAIAGVKQSSIQNSNDYTVDLQLSGQDSFEKFNVFNTEEPNDDNTKNSVNYSVYLQNQQYQVEQVSPTPPLFPVSLPPKPQNRQSPKKQSQNNHNTSNDSPFNKSVNKSQNQINKAFDKACFNKKKESLHSSSSNSNKNGINDSIYGFDVPIAQKLQSMDKQSLNSSSSSKDAPKQAINSKKPIKCIKRFQIQIPSNKITFHLNDSTQIQKVISSPYLQYLQKYFFYNFNILLPMHMSEILETNSKQDSQPTRGYIIYLNIYFEYIKSKYSDKLLQFLQKSNFKLQEKTQQEPSKTYFNQKLQQYKNLVMNTISTGKQIVDNVYKKIKGQSSNTIRLLQRIFFKQIEIAEKQKKARQMIQGITSLNNINSSVYQKGGQDKKISILMCLRWLLGFELTIQLIKQKQSKADAVQVQKLQFLVNQFTIQKQNQQAEKIKSLRDQIKNIYQQ